MGKVGQSLIQGAKDALAIAKQEMMPAAVWRTRRDALGSNNATDHVLQKTRHLQEGKKTRMVKSTESEL